MAQSLNSLNFENEDEIEAPPNLDNTCPECGTDSITTFEDRYSSYEYCTNCDWSDEETDDGSSDEPAGRRDRGQFDG